MIRITAPHFVAGVVPGVRAAPIIGYMRDWCAGEIVAYCARKGWKIDTLEIDEWGGLE